MFECFPLIPVLAEFFYCTETKSPSSPWFFSHTRYEILQATKQQHSAPTVNIHHTSMGKLQSTFQKLIKNGEQTDSHQKRTEVITIPPVTQVMPNSPLSSIRHYSTYCNHPPTLTNCTNQSKFVEEFTHCTTAI